VRGYWFDYWDYSQSIAGFSMKMLTTTSGIVQTPLVPYCQELFPGKCELLIWQFCEILTTMLLKYHSQSPFSGVLPKTKNPDHGFYSQVQIRSLRLFS
jgi:hypothetical protein